MKVTSRKNLYTLPWVGQHMETPTPRGVPQDPNRIDRRISSKPKVTSRNKKCPYPTHQATIIQPGLQMLEIQRARFTSNKIPITVLLTNKYRLELSQSFCQPSGESFLSSFPNPEILKGISQIVTIRKGLSIIWR